MPLKEKFSHFALKKFPKFKGKSLCRSKGLQYKPSPVNFETFLRTTFLQNISVRLLYYYKVNLIKYLTEWSLKVYNNLNYFYNGIESVKSTLIKNTYPLSLTDKVLY